jgi:predicted kinase
MPDVVVLIGLQASGKSSFYRARFAATHRLVSKDTFPSARNKTKRQAREIAETLAGGTSVVVDNTNPTLEERAAIVAQARLLGARPVAYYFESIVADCLVRNALREGKSRVPDVGILATAKRLARPRLDEGFDELWYVRFGVDGARLVLPWEEP